MSSPRELPDLDRLALDYFYPIQRTALLNERQRLQEALKKARAEKERQERTDYVALYVPTLLTGISSERKNEATATIQTLEGTLAATEVEMKDLFGDSIDSSNPRFKAKYLQASLQQFLKARDVAGELELHRAIRRGESLAYIRYILTVCPDQLNALGGLPGKTLYPLHYAAKYDREELIDLFKERGVPLNLACERGKTIAHYAAQKGHARLLKKYRDVLIYAGDHKGRTPLHLAAKFNRVEAVNMLFADNPRLAWMPDKSGSWPVALASSRSIAKANDKVGHLKTVAQLIELMNAQIALPPVSELKQDTASLDVIQKSVNVYAALKAYGKNLISGLKIPITTSAGITSFYTLQILHDSYDSVGIKCVGLIPDHPTENLKIVFLGLELKDDELDLVRSLRAFEKDQMDWAQRERVIVNQVSPALLNLLSLSNETPSIELLGQGLGGVDAQLALYAMLRHAQAPLPALHLIAHNSFRAVNSMVNQAANEWIARNNKLTVACDYIEELGSPSALIGTTYLLEGSRNCKVHHVQNDDLALKIQHLVQDMQKDEAMLQEVDAACNVQKKIVEDRKALEADTSFIAMVQKKMTAATLQAEEEKFLQLTSEKDRLVKTKMNASKTLADYETKAFRGSQQLVLAKFSLSLQDLKKMEVNPENTAKDAKKEEMVDIFASGLKGAVSRSPLVRIGLNVVDTLLGASEKAKKMVRAESSVDWQALAAQSGFGSVSLKESKRESKAATMSAVWGADDVSRFIQRDRSAELQRYANGEYLYHHLINSIEQFQVNDRVAVPQEGKAEIYRVAVEPITFEGITNAILIPENGEGDIKVLFRGTGDLASIHRDFSMGGAGVQSYLRAAPHLLQNLIEAMQTHQANRRAKNLPEAKIQIEVGGHSLGAADAQMFMATTMTEMLQTRLSDPLSPLNQIFCLRMLAYNAPGIAEDINHKGIMAAKQLSSTGVKIAAYYQRVHKDPVQQSGDSHLFIMKENDKKFKAATPDIATVETLKIQYTGALVVANTKCPLPPHQDFHFRDGDSSYARNIFRNNTLDGALGDEFSARFETEWTEAAKEAIAKMTQPLLTRETAPRGLASTATFTADVKEQKRKPAIVVEEKGSLLASHPSNILPSEASVPSHGVDEATQAMSHIIGRKSR